MLRDLYITEMLARTQMAERLREAEQMRLVRQARQPACNQPKKSDEQNRLRWVWRRLSLRRG